MRCFIISQPKAGTYLCSNLLVQLGMHQTGMHCSDNGVYQKYNVTDPNAINNKDECTYNLPVFDDVLDLIPENGFAVGHLRHKKHSINALRTFKKILVVRPFEDLEGSARRFKEDLGHNIFTSERTYTSIKRWEVESDVFVISFYDMINKRIKKIDQLQKYLFDEVTYVSQKAIDQALLAPSLTKSSIRKGTDI